MDEKMKKLLTPINIGNVTVKNRFFVGPMGIDYNNGAYSDPRRRTSNTSWSAPRRLRRHFHRLHDTR